MRRSIATLLGAMIVAGGACGMKKLPEPPLTGHPTSALEPVPYPPPPARTERIPAKPTDEGAVWIDGEWIWEGRRWAWKPGRWVLVPEGARFAPWTTVRDRTGSLYVASGVFRDADGGVVDDPRPIAVARARAGSVVDPEGAQVVGPTVPSESLYDSGAPPGARAVDAEAADALFDAGAISDAEAIPLDAAVEGGVRMAPP